MLWAPPPASAAFSTMEWESRVPRAVAGGTAFCSLGQRALRLQDADSYLVIFSTGIMSNLPVEV